MSYFAKFPTVAYSFGDVGELAITQDISKYVDILDKVKTNASFYRNYYIRNSDRADTLAYEFYGDPKLHWLFYLANDKIAEQGWPLNNIELVKKVKSQYTGLVLTTSDDIIHTFQVGQTVQGNSGSGTVVYRNLDLGQVVLDDVTGQFIEGEQVTSNSETESLIIDGVTEEHLALRYYLDGVPVTNMEHYEKENEELRSIIVIKNDAVSSILDIITSALDNG